MSVYAPGLVSPRLAFLRLAALRKGVQLEGEIKAIARDGLD